MALLIFRSRQSVRQSRYLPDSSSMETAFLAPLCLAATCSRMDAGRRGRGAAPLTADGGSGVATTFVLEMPLESGGSSVTTVSTTAAAAASRPDPLPKPPPPPTAKFRDGDGGHGILRSVILAITEVGRRQNARAETLARIGVFGRRSGGSAMSNGD